MLYLPTFDLRGITSAPSGAKKLRPPVPSRRFYLHYINSIDTNYQCNTRSGRSNGGTKAIHHCTPGFDSRSVGEPNERGQSDRHAHGKLND